MGIGAKRCKTCHKILNDDHIGEMCRKCSSKAHYPNHPEIKFYNGISKEIKFGLGSYFDERIVIVSSVTQMIALFVLIPAFFTIHWYALLLVPFILFGWGKFWLHLPIFTENDECDPPEYGYYFYGEGKIFDSFWLCKGRKKICKYMPWALDWVRTSALVKSNSSMLSKNSKAEYKEGAWLHETSKNRLNFYEDMWKSVLWLETYPYKYTLKSGKEQNVLATVRVQKREWRPKWFKWTKLFRHVSKDIEIEFNSEVGEETGSWKCGCIGCGYKMLPGETPLDTLRRMEKERKF
jgi:hypothetical protein